jgi:hypothetical protein
MERSSVIFNSPTTYQVFEPMKKTMITITQIDVEEVNRSSSKKTRQSTWTSSPNVEHEELVKELNMLPLNTLEAIVNIFGTLNYVTKDRWH